MPANSRTLPSGYTASDVSGVTRGSSRPTVYFKDHSRFTQIHRHADNIGYHNPPANQLYFGNVPESFYQSHLRDQPDRQVFVQDLMAGNAPAVPAPLPGERVRLFEVKERKGGGVATHPSRSAFETVTIAEAQQLIADIRSRSGNVGGPNQNGEYYFL